jgi:hypothetical protein
VLNCCANVYINKIIKTAQLQGRIQDFKLGGGALNFFFGVFRVKNHDFTPKNHIFSNFRGGGGRGRPPPGSAPALMKVQGNGILYFLGLNNVNDKIIFFHNFLRFLC